MGLPCRFNGLAALVSQFLKNPSLPHALERDQDLRRCSRSRSSVREGEVDAKSYGEDELPSRAIGSEDWYSVPMNRIAVFDSGLGGLTVLKTLRAHFPQVDFYYLGDNARLPYGSKSPEVVQRYSLECARFLATFEPDALVVACNTASSLALEHLERECPFPVIGMIDPIVEHVISEIKPSSLAVLGTKATIASGAYQNKFAAQSTTIDVHAVSCPLFVPFVEEGIFHGPLLKRVLDLYLNPLRAHCLDAVILGCTHYPLLHKELAAYLGESVQVVECGQGVLAELAKLPMSASKTKGSAQFFVTDDATSFSHLASLFLGDPPRVEKVELGAAYGSAVGW